MRRYHKTSLHKLGGLVKGSLSNLGFENKVMQHQAAGRWREIVGPQIAASTIVENVRDGVLFVCCKSSVWSNELSFHKEDIVKRLNKAVGKKVILDIRFSAKGFRRLSSTVREEDEEAGEKDFEAIQVSEADLELANKAAAAAPSEELAEKIRKAILASKRLAELRRLDERKKCPKCSSLHNGKSDLCDNCR